MKELFFVLSLVFNSNKEIPIDPNEITSYVAYSVKELTEYLTMKDKEDHCLFKVYRVSCNTSKCVSQFEPYYSTLVTP